jgi:hypothetical protein
MEHQKLWIRLRCISGEGLRQGFPSPAGCQEELLDPSDLATMMAASCSMFQGKAINPLGFFPWGTYRRKGNIRRWASWPHPLVAWARGRPRHPRVWPAPGPPPSHLWSSRSLVKIEGLAFVSSNSENISCVAFLKHKNSRK